MGHVISFYFFKELVDLFVAIFYYFFEGGDVLLMGLSFGLDEGFYLGKLFLDCVYLLFFDLVFD